MADEIITNPKRMIVTIDVDDGDDKSFAFDTYECLEIELNDGGSVREQREYAARIIDVLKFWIDNPEAIDDLIDNGPPDDDGGSLEYEDTPEGREHRAYLQDLMQRDD